MPTEQQSDGWKVVPVKTKDASGKKTMAEYIDRDALLAHLKKDPLFDLVERYGISGVIESIPAADVRPVVTCENCKHNKRAVIDLWGTPAIQCVTGQTHHREWFCADGERRSNA